MEVRSLGEIIAEFQNTKKWFKSIGVSTVGTRLDEIDRYLHELLNPTGSEPSPFNISPNSSEVYRALNDAAGLGRVARGLANISSQVMPRGALRDCLRGPFNLSEEVDPATRDPRNKFVELELAAFCADAGVAVIGFDDVKFEFEGVRYLIQCKRPASRRSLDTNIEKAYEQLLSRLAENERGIVAIALEKVFDLDDSLQAAESPRDLSRIGVEVAKSFQKTIARYHSQWIDPRVVGIAAIIRFLGHIKKSDQIAYSYQVGILKFASEHHGQAADSFRLDRLSAVLRGQEHRPLGRLPWV